MLQRNKGAVTHSNRKIDNYFFCEDFSENSIHTPALHGIVNASPETITFDTD